MDSQAQVGESDERNNVSLWLEIQLPLEIKQPSMSAKLAELKPDLTLTSADINIYPSSHLAGGDNIGVQANVRNPGTAAGVKVGVRALELPGRVEVLYSETVIRPSRREAASWLPSACPAGCLEWGGTFFRSDWTGTVRSRRPANRITRRRKPSSSWGRSSL